MKTLLTALTLMFAVTPLGLCGCDAILHVSGHVIDSNKAPVTGAEVTVTAGDALDSRLPPYTRKSDTTGSFIVPVVYSPRDKKPNFQIRVTKQGYTDSTKAIPESGFVGQIVLLPSNPDGGGQ